MAAHVDYEGAWVELGDRLRAKKGWGARELQELMAEIAAKHTLPEHFVQTVLRLYGGQVHLHIQPPETGAAPDGDSLAGEKPPDPGSSTTERSHDERAGQRGAAVGV